MALLPSTTNKRTRVRLLAVDAPGTGGNGRESNIGTGKEVGFTLKVPQATQTANSFSVQAQPVAAAPVDLFDVTAVGDLIHSGVTNVQRCIRQIALTAAQITTLHSVPVALVAAPGAGIVLIAKAMYFNFKYGTTQFTGGGATNPVYHGATTNLLTGSVAAATVLAAANATISAGGPAAALALTANVGIDLYAATQDYAAGDSVAAVTLIYDVLTLS